ncbi:MAG: sugar ABC transporter substrate-binding protein [Vallitaleaceae bacterium]|nr:sugar ABC transporter substrate-binding protein [Vallitaleaceae bacterium]
MKKILSLLFVIILLCSAMSACSKKEAVVDTKAGEESVATTEAAKATKEAAPAQKEYIIAFCYQDLETEFWVASHKAITETLEAQGITVIEKNANQDANKQLEQVKDVIAQGVDGIIIIAQDGESAVTIAAEANKAGIPIGIYNRPPSSTDSDAIVVVADNEVIAEQSVEHMALMAKEKGGKVTPLIIVGDLGDPNAVARRQGFMNVIEKYPDLFNEVIEVPSQWDAAVALANLQSALQANPDVDFIFTSSDFLYPQIKAVLDPLGKWKKIGDKDHVILAGLDGDTTAGQLMDDGYVDATGVQDLYFEAQAMLEAIVKAVDDGEKNPAQWIQDPGFALTQANIAERKMDMWGNKLRADK